MQIPYAILIPSYEDVREQIVRYQDYNPILKSHCDTNYITLIPGIRDMYG